MTEGIQYTVRPPRRRVILAVAVSLLLHLAVLSEFGLFSVAGEPAYGPPLQIRLLAAPSPVTVDTQVPAPPPSTPPVRETATPATRPSPPSEKAPIRVPDPVPSKPAVAPAVADVAAAPAAGAPSAIPLPGLTGRVRRVAIDFEFSTGADRQVVATGRHVYLSENGDYYNVSISQTSATADAPAAGNWQVEISGRVTGQGLRPVRVDARGEVGESLVSWQAPAAGASRAARRARMPDGLLDRQSLLYQFMARPPEMSGGQLWLSDGQTHRLFEYRFAGFDSLPLTVLGGVRAIKLVLKTEGSTETIELWLAPEMHYLPVKARFTDRDGAVSEQLATSLDFSR